METELNSIDGGVFFSNDPDNPDNLWRFYADVQMYANGASIDPKSFFSGWQTSEITSSENDWMGGNIPRWSNEQYDNLYKELRQTTAGTEREDLFIKLNDLLVENYVVIPLIERASVSAFSNNLKGVRVNGWDSELWNIHEWYRE